VFDTFGYSEFRFAIGAQHVVGEIAATASQFSDLLWIRDSNCLHKR